MNPVAIIAWSCLTLMAAWTAFHWHQAEGTANDRMRMAGSAHENTAAENRLPNPVAVVQTDPIRRQRMPAPVAVHARAPQTPPTAAEP